MDARGAMGSLGAMGTLGAVTAHLQQDHRREGKDGCIT